VAPAVPILLRNSGRINFYLHMLRRIYPEWAESVEGMAKFHLTSTKSSAYLTEILNDTHKYSTA
jgi:hypothetical protein